MTTNVSTQVTHFDKSFGLDLRTSCGKSLHGWANPPRNTTKRDHEVTCKRCIKKMASE